MRRHFVTFTGGLGAQLMSAAVYFDAELQGRPLLADLRYFDLPPRVAAVGDGSISIWPWALHAYGLGPHSFRSAVPNRVWDFVIRDGPEKAVLAFAALRRAEVRQHFPLTMIDNAELSGMVSSAVVLHLRRGDYLNVASHVVPDADAIEAALGLRHISADLIILSDGEVPASTRAALSQAYKQVVAPVDVSATDAHSLMRMARALVTSNSQFSLTAGLLRTDGLTLIPGTWFGPGMVQLEAAMTGISGFRLLRGARS